MAQIFTSPPSEPSRRILCSYINATRQIQIARIANSSSWYFERVVFPEQRLLFEALPNAQLEIHTCITPSATLSDKILCARLQINEGSNFFVKTSNE